MAISQFLLDILVCPETKRPVKLADPALVERLNAQVAAGQLKNKAGKTVTDPFTAGLLRDDGKLLYPVRDDIPVMLVEEGIPIG